MHFGLDGLSRDRDDAMGDGGTHGGGRETRNGRGRASVASERKILVVGE